MTIKSNNLLDFAVLKQSSKKPPTPKKKLRTNSQIEIIKQQHAENKIKIQTDFYIFDC